MKKLEVIGNLGADARIETQNGRQFVALSIADTRRTTDEQGQVHETTDWISATINGDGGKIFPYLKKGVKVYASGDCAIRQFHSEKQRALVAGLKLFVRDIELISTNTDDVPRDLYDKAGKAYRTGKYYHTAEAKSVELYNRQGEPFAVDANGFITRVVAATEPAQATESQSAESETNDDQF